MGNTYVKEPEYAKFMEAMGLSEQEFLEAAGGVKGYTELRLLCSDARGTMVANDYPGVDYLPQTPEEALEKYRIKDSKLTPQTLARQMLHDQREKAQGIVQVAKASKAIREGEAKAKADKEANIRREAAYLAKSYPDYCKDTEEECMTRAIREVKARRPAI